MLLLKVLLPKVLLAAASAALDGLGSGFMGDGAGDSSCNCTLKERKRCRLNAFAHLDAGTGGGIAGVDVAGEE